MGKIKLTEKIELYIRYAMDFFDECKDKNKIYELLINREDLLSQLDKTPDSFWNEVKKQKVLYVYEDLIKWSPTQEEKETIVTKFQGYYKQKTIFPVLVYEKQMEDIYSKKLYRPI